MTKKQHIPPNHSRLPLDIFKDQGLELILSILLAVSLGQSLNLFITLPTTETWFLSSVITIGFTITVVYMVLGVRIEHWYRDLTRIISIGFFMFFPFAFQRANVQNLGPQNIEWTTGSVFVYVALIGIPLFLWANAENMLNKKTNLQSNKTTILTVMGVVFMIVGLLAWAYWKIQ